MFGEKRFWGGMVLLWVLIGLGLLGVQVWAQPVPVPAGSSGSGVLFTPLTVTEAADVASLDARAEQYGEGLVRRQYTAVDTTALAYGQAEELTLTLFPGESFTVTHRRTDYYDSGYVWVGQIKGLPYSDVSFSVFDGGIIGTFNALGRSYHIRPVNENSPNTAVIEHLNYGAFPPGGEPIIPPPPADPPQPEPDPNSPNVDNGSVIDVLVVYTPNARNQMGGTAASEALINLAMSETNTGYENSQIAPRVNLVYQGEIAYTESGMGTDLSRLRITNDGFMDEVHGLRNTYHADLVVLLTDDISNQFCGLAYLMTSNSVAFAPNAFAVVDYSCATGFYSFGHEMGHNMGNQHDRANSSSQGVFNYSYGYQDPNHFRTVMAYACDGVACNRINYYSNPNVFVNGRTTGIATSASNSAFNALSMNNVAFTVANFRQRPANWEPTATPTTIPTNTPTATATNTPTATPTYPYFTAVLIESNVFRLRGYNWPTNEAIDLALNGITFYTVPAGHNGTFDIRLRVEGASNDTFTITATSDTAFAGIEASLRHNYLPYISKPAVATTPTPSPTPTATPTLTPTPTATPQSGTHPFAQEVVNIVNTERAKVGCNPVTMDSRLLTAAYKHSQDMGDNDYFSHTGLNGSSPWDRMEAEGYNFSTAGENIAAGSNSPTGVMTAWMNSSGHRGNILNCDFIHIGVGYYYKANDTGNINYTHYWTQVFGTP